MRKGRYKKDGRGGDVLLSSVLFVVFVFCFLNCEKKKKEKRKKEKGISDIGNRTRGEHVRDANVTNYTISELPFFLKETGLKMKLFNSMGLEMRINGMNYDL